MTRVGWREHRPWPADPGRRSKPVSCHWIRISDPVSWILLPVFVSCILFPVTDILYHSSGILHHRACIIYQFFWIMFPGSCFLDSVYCLFSDPVSWILFPVFCVQYPYPVSWVLHTVSRTESQKTNNGSLYHRSLSYRCIYSFDSNICKVCKLELGI